MNEADDPRLAILSKWRIDRLRDAYAWVTSDERGRVVLQSIIEEARVNGYIHPGEQADFQLGQRWVGLTILETVRDIDPELPRLMEKAYELEPPIDDSAIAEKAEMDEGGDDDVWA